MKSIIKFYLKNSTQNQKKVVNQHYDPALLPTEYVMRGNAAILKCSIPSFVADFVSVTAWVDDEENEILPTDDDFDGS